MWRAPWAFILGVILLSGSLALHPARESYDVPGASGVGDWSQSAEHPNATAHFEQDQTARRRAFPICLHKLRTGGACLTAMASLAAPSLAGFHRPVVTLLLVEHHAAPRGARGPPAA